MKFKNSFLLSFMVVFMLSCSAIKKTSSSPIKQSSQGFSPPQFDDSSLNLLPKYLSDYSRELGCIIRNKVVSVGFVITKESNIEQISFSVLIPNECQKAVEKTLNRLKILSPAMENGKPIEVYNRIPFRFT